MKASWNGQVIAESDETVLVDNNHYFPKESLHESFFTTSDHTTVCGWKGKASYYSLLVDGKSNENAAWFYPDPLEKAEKIRDYVAFWNGVTVSE